jgi:hypothetical protein
VDHEKVVKQYENYLTPNGKIVVSLNYPESNRERYDNIRNFSRTYFHLVDKFELNGFIQEKGITFKVDVYEKKKI